MESCSFTGLVGTEKLKVSKHKLGMVINPFRFSYKTEASVALFVYVFSMVYEAIEFIVPCKRYPKDSYLQYLGCHTEFQF